jgi:hypothetical protein
MMAAADTPSFGLGISFYKDWKPALQTTEDFAARLGRRRASVPLLLELDLEPTDRLNDGVPVQEALQRFAGQGWRDVRIWTRDTTEKVHHGWPAGLDNPFDRGFSYGGIAVKIQALARQAGCDHVVRTDPGCRAPDDLPAAIRRHLECIEQGAADLVCGRYDRRYAIRTDFLPDAPPDAHAESRDELFRLVEAFTRVVPERQIVGGALNTFPTQGPPPPPFDDVKIVLSDDGFMGTVLGARAVIDPSTVIPRSKPGLFLTSHDYRVRLSMMAALDRLWDGKPVANAVTAAVVFYRAIGALVDATRRSDVDVAGARAAIDGRADLIARGLERYRALLAGRWIDCLDVVASRSEWARATNVDSTR